MIVAANVGGQTPFKPIEYDPVVYEPMRTEKLQYVEVSFVR